MKSWKTFASGLVAAVGLYLAKQTDPSWLHNIGDILSMIGTAGTGFFARDNNVSSEQAGIKPTIVGVVEDVADMAKMVENTMKGKLP